MVPAKDLKNNTLTELQSVVESLDCKKYLAGYIFSFIHVKGVNVIDDITPLPRALRKKLVDAGFYISALKTLETFTDPDGTAKFLFEMGDGNRIETVLMVDSERKTLCLSTQAGCKMNCAFCATGKLKFKRNLTAGEIVDQVIAISRQQGKINNVVYMGMGEPMDNYQAVMKSVHILNDPAGLDIGARHITISTCGILQGIEKLAEEKLQIRLAVSLNAANDSTRSKLMAINNTYPLPALIKAIKTYQRRTGRRVTFEYIMINGLNDSSEDAQKLCRLIKDIKANINLIEYNPHTGCEFSASPRDKIKVFRDVLSESGREVHIRYKRGRNIKAACGQLGSTLLENKQAQ
ncbi:MAG: 23S rRNA (adenine(2503)-C(2))-methyltransferase RlmN [Planctomycetota bacterium]